MRRAVTVGLTASEASLDVENWTPSGMCDESEGDVNGNHEHTATQSVIVRA